MIPITPLNARAPVKKRQLHISADTRIGENRKSLPNPPPTPLAALRMAFSMRRAASHQCAGSRSRCPSRSGNIGWRGTTEEHDA